MPHSAGGIGTILVLPSSAPQKDKDEAIKGFRRYLDLDDAEGKPVDKHGKPKDQNWYHVSIVRPHAEARLAALTAS